MASLGLCVGLIIGLAVTPGGSQEVRTTKPNKLLSGRLIYVAPMPAEIDKWIMEDLRAWRKYQVTANPEGVDLVIRPNAPEKDTRYVLRQGVPQPKRERSAAQTLSISVVDWVTNQTLWRVDVVDRKLRKDEPEPPPGPNQRIFARGLVPDQIAQRLVSKLREYVAELEKAEGTRR